MARSVIFALSDQDISKCLATSDPPKSIRCGDGLVLRRLASGRYSFQYPFVIEGERGIASYGTWPDVDLATARKQQLDDRQAVKREMINPVTVRAAEKKTRQAEAERLAMLPKRTFKSVAEEWVRETMVAKRWGDHHIHQVNQSLNDHVYPTLANRQIDDIEPTEVLKILRKLSDAGKAETARRVSKRVEMIFAYAIGNLLRQDNPVSAIAGCIAPTATKRKQPCVKPDELPHLLRRIDDYHVNHGGERATTLALQFMLLTFQRTKEMIYAEWREFDLDNGLWNIPGMFPDDHHQLPGQRRMKHGREHVVPLAKQAIAILRQLQELNGNCRYVFADSRNTRNHMSNNTMLYAFYRLGYRGRHTGHGCRALASTLLNESGQFLSDWIEFQQARVTQGVRGRYNRAQYLNHRIRMMQWWADHLDSVRAGGPVIPPYVLAVGLMENAS
jgi:integrase